MTKHLSPLSSAPLKEAYENLLTGRTIGKSLLKDRFKNKFNIAEGRHYSLIGVVPAFQVHYIKLVSWLQNAEAARRIEILYSRCC